MLEFPGRSAQTADEQEPSLPVTIRTTYRRREGMMVSGLAGGIAGLLLGVLLLRNILGTAPSPLDYLYLIPPVVVGAFSGAMLFDWRRWYEVEVTQSTVTLRHPRRALSIPSSDVCLVIGLGGLSFSGGEMLVWKKTALVTSTRIHVLGLGEANQHLYHALRLACPLALGLPYGGSVEPPSLEDVESQRKVFAALPQAAAVLSAQAIGSFVISGVCLCAAIGATVMFCLAVAKSQAGAEKALAQVGVFAIVMGVSVVLSMMNSWRTAQRARMVRRVVQQMGVAEGR